MPAVAAGLVVLASAVAAGGGRVEVVVPSSGTPGCTGFVMESLSGAVSRCVPFAGGAGDVPQDFAAAADGTVVFRDLYPLNDGFGDSGNKIELVHANGNAVELDQPAYWWEADTYPSISADGSKVAFLGPSADPNAWPSIYVVKADGSGRRVVASGEATALSAPAISPDGGSIAYWCVSMYQPTTPYRPAGRLCGPLPDGSYRQSGVMLMNADGTDKRVIVIGPRFVADDAAAIGSLSWSPNGRWLTMDGLAPGGCAVRPAGCNQQVFVYRTDGSDLFNYLNPRGQITNVAPSGQVTHEKKGTGPAAPAAPQFCGSSSQILYESGSHAYLIDRNGTHRQRTALNAGKTGTPACVPPPGGKGPPPTVNVMRVTVPAVRTLVYAAAERRLERAHLHVGVVKQAFSARIAQGHVIAQHPRAGARVRRSTEQGPPVTLVLSRGPRP